MGRVGQVFLVALVLFIVGSVLLEQLGGPPGARWSSILGWVLGGALAVAVVGGAAVSWWRERRHGRQDPPPGFH